MMQLSSRSPLQALALDAELAGTAMACRYGSSSEYEAALIAERRAAGAYGRPLRRHGLALWSAITAAMLLTIILSF